MHEHQIGDEPSIQRSKPFQKKILAGQAHALTRLTIGAGKFLPFVFLMLSLVGASPSAAPYNPALSEYDQPTTSYYQQDKRLADERQESYRKRVPMNDAAGPDVPLARTVALQNEASAPVRSLVATAEAQRQNLLAFAFLLLLGALCIRKFAPMIADYLNKEFNPWALASANGVDFSGKMLAEDGDFSEFLATFRGGSTAKASTPFGGSGASAQLVEFFDKSPKFIETLRRLIQQLDGDTGKSARRKVLADLQRELRTVKGATAIPELLPAWQMASALEGFTKQLIDRVRHVTPSTVRSVHGGVDLLEKLCGPGVKPDLLSNPPFRLLVVDDDLISRKAVAYALKKALNPPDLAENAETALGLAMDNPYDVIFLDVQMPGMDGFELCGKIHETAPNRNTPVVFVTCQSDFESRAQSTLSGGHDLIAKPFLTFEITVKALTLAIEGRLRGGAQLAINPVVAPLPAPTKDLPVAVVPVEKSPAPVASAQPQILPPVAVTKISVLPDIPASPPLSEAAQAFLTGAGAHIKPLRELIQAVLQTTDESVQWEMLTDFYLRLHSFPPEVPAVKGHPVFRLRAALEGLLQKILERTQLRTSSALVTVATAVDLLSELCSAKVTADMVINPPIQMLVVDDDPVARRAMTFALQMTFQKPVSAESGEAAVASANENSFDVIFMDVQMPGMDGFTACSKIRETARNRRTPVVFVTAYGDLKARAQSSLNGGSDLMTKPTLTAEISVKALTFVLRSRLQKIRVEENGGAMTDESTQIVADLSDNRRRRARSEKQSRRR